jgi:cytosine/uracil/thiamine/allantoin permease
MLVTSTFLTYIRIETSRKYAVYYLDLFVSFFIAFIVYLLVEKKFKGKERFLGYYAIGLLLFVLS